jgi:hypothetical protein
VVVVADCHPHRLAPWRLGDGTVWKHLGSEGTEPGQFQFCFFEKSRSRALKKAFFNASIF